MDNSPNLLSGFRPQTWEWFTVKTMAQNLNCTEAEAMGILRMLDIPLICGCVYSGNDYIVATHKLQNGTLMPVVAKRGRNAICRADRPKYRLYEEREGELSDGESELCEV